MLAAAGPGGSERAAGLQGGEQRGVAGVAGGGVAGVAFSQGRGERELRWRGGDREDGWEVEWEGEEEVKEGKEELVPEVDDPDLLNLVSVCVCVCVCV